MKSLVILIFLSATCWSQEIKKTDSKKAPTQAINKARILYDFGKVFKIQTDKEVMISYKNNPAITTSRRTTVISGHNYSCRVLSNGFVELSNEAGIILIPMNNVISIKLPPSKTKKDNKSQ